MYITTRYSYETTRGRQLDVTTWLASVYEHTPVQSDSNTCKHSHGFYHTRTYQGEHPYDAYIKRHHVRALLRCQDLIDRLRAEHPEPYEEMYETFYIPKASGGQRRIDAPLPFLKEVMHQIKQEFENTIRVQYHDCCYSYFSGRGTKDALMVHQRNESKWFAKFDMKDFFPNTTKDFLRKQLQQLYPFAYLFTDPTATPALEKILDMAMYNGGLPQGTPLSPMFTNLMMIPVDFKLTHMCYNNGPLIYTRYADDILISSRHTFEHARIQNLIVEVLNSEEAPFTINEAKTRYGSAAGSNWNLGLMLNKDNRITIGHKRKQVIRATVNNFLKDFTQGRYWATIDVQTMLGELSYLRNVEAGYADYIIGELERKYAVDFRLTVKRVLNTPALEVTAN